MSGGARCCFGFLVAMAQILLHGVVGLVLFWVFKYHSDDNEDNPWPFSWRTNYKLEFNLHPVLMILGFIYFMGQGTLMLAMLLLNFKFQLPVFFQPCWCTDRADVVDASGANFCIPCSIFWLFHALSLASLQHGTTITTEQMKMVNRLPFQTFTVSILGWVWQQWDFLPFRYF